MWTIGTSICLLQRGTFLTRSLNILKLDLTLNLENGEEHNEKSKFNRNREKTDFFVLNLWSIDTSQSLVLKVDFVATSLDSPKPVSALNLAYGGLSNIFCVNFTKMHIIRHESYFMIISMKLWVPRQIQTFTESGNSLFPCILIEILSVLSPQTISEQDFFSFGVTATIISSHHTSITGVRFWTDSWTTELSLNSKGDI